MVLVDRANPTDRLDVERLIAAYHASEGAKPKPERISWAVDQVLRNRFPGVVLIGREKKAVVGVALAVYSPSAELGRVLVVNDFFVDPAARRKGARFCLTCADPLPGRLPGSAAGRGRKWHGPQHGWKHGIQ